MGLFTYIRGSSLSEADRIDGIAAGTLEAWRVAEDGEIWFKRARLPLIHGVPRDEYTAIAEMYDDEVLDDADAEMSLVDSDGEIIATDAVRPMHIGSGEVAFDFGGEA